MSVFQNARSVAVCNRPDVLTSGRLLLTRRPLVELALSDAVAELAARRNSFLSSGHLGTVVALQSACAKILREGTN